ncbi:MAG: SDR family oxidoreductase [Bacteroidetes bacterium]|nr:SDR family oxidoreductase [Bacteroidota bacterium]
MKKNILITGGSSGIGAEIVRTLAKEDYVSGLGIQYNQSKEGALRLQKKFGTYVEIEQLKADFNSSSVDLVERFLEKFHYIDVLINCAGVVSSVSFDELTVQEYDRVMHVNSRYAYLITKDAFNSMKERGGKIINISGAATSFGMGRNHSIQYAASKATLDILTIGLARMGAKYNILVNSVSPGLIMTRLHENRIDKKARANLVPLKRFGTPGDIADMVEFLVSDKGNFITGQVFRISGGE